MNVNVHAVTVNCTGVKNISIGADVKETEILRIASSYKSLSLRSTLSEPHDDVQAGNIGKTESKENSKIAPLVLVVVIQSCCVVIASSIRTVSALGSAIWVLQVTGR